MLKLQNLSLRYEKDQVLRDVSFEVAEGELVCLLGPSGCGKTTTLRLIAGFEKPETGQIIIGDQVVSNARHTLAPQKRGLGFLFQDYALFPHLTVAENIGYGLSGRAKKEAVKQTWEMLRQIELLDHADKYPHELSGGEQQRVAIGRAIATGPDLLLADEPTGNLDPHTADEVFDLLLRLARGANLAAVIATHNPGLASRMDRIARLEDGHLIEN